MIRFNCKHCDKIFLDSKCRNRNYCSRTCYRSIPNNVEEMRCLNCDKKFYSRLSNNRKYCSKNCSKMTTGFRKGHIGYKAWLGKSLTEETKNKLRMSKLGKKQSLLTRKKRSLSLMGEKAPNWQGGKSKESILIRGSLEYRLWRESVFERDNYTCKICGKRGNGELNADHIKPFAYFIEDRFNVNNGRTLCLDCHKQTENYGGKGFKREHYIHKHLQ